MDKDFYLTLNGRVSRSQFFKHWFLPLIGISIVLSLICVLLHMPALYNLFCLAMIWPSICVSAKRLHDRGKSGWWQLMTLIPLIGLIWYIAEVMAGKSNPGDNAYGPEPDHPSLKLGKLSGGPI